MPTRWIALLLSLVAVEAAQAATHVSLPGTASGRVRIDYRAETQSGSETLVDGWTAALSDLVVEAEIGPDGVIEHADVRLAVPIVVESQGARIELHEIVAGSIANGGAGLGELGACGVRGTADGEAVAWEGEAGRCGVLVAVPFGDEFDWQWLLDQVWSLQFAVGDTTFQLDLTWIGPIGGPLVVAEPETALLLGIAGFAIARRMRPRGARRQPTWNAIHPISM